MVLLTDGTLYIAVEDGHTLAGAVMLNAAGAVPTVAVKVLLLAAVVELLQYELASVQATVNVPLAAVVTVIELVPPPATLLCPAPVTVQV